MAESSVINSEEIANCEIEIEKDSTTPVSVKKEEEVNVKPEPHECVVCSVQSNETNDIFTTQTTISHISLNDFLFKFTNVNIAGAQNCTKYICRTCYELINVLDQAEFEYLRLKQTLEDIISKNPLYQAQTHEVQLEVVKSETFGDDYDGSKILNRDSEDEPLSVTKKKRHGRKRKQLGKRKITLKKESWECNLCGEQGTVGGVASEAAHRLVKHSFQEEGVVIANVKKEDYADGSQSPNFVNGFDDADEGMFKVELETDDDDSPNFIPDLLKEGKKEKKTRIILGRKAIRKSAAPMPKKRKKREAKAIHKCDKCSSTFTSLARLECHLQKHEDSKPPYICEICGAHYKHKRACDIHIALHKGISDWKCEECNKLFPSKGALQRHNNIHTGKSNYQCDLCGKSFIHTSSFKMHKLSHSGVKPHACDVCGLALMTRSHLKRHKRVHSGEKRHECNVCGKRFSERYNLAAHSKSHDTTAAATPSPAEPVPRRRLFRCNFCQERFERRYMLERHMSVAHGRALERPPPTPRNTMSKLLKAQAQRGEPARAAAVAAHRDHGTTTKQEPSPEPHTPQKLITITTSIPPSAWSNAYAAEFGIPRSDFPH